MTATGTDAVEAMRGGLTVSCQAYPGEPMRDPRTTAQVARSVVAGGAVALRIQGIDDLRAVVPVVDVPVVGLWKDGEEGVLITPTVDHALAVLAAGADVVAVDGTRRPRPDGRDLAATIAAIRAVHPGAVVMADCGSVDDAVAAERAGADLLGTTLAGYTGERPRTDGPDLDLLDEVRERWRSPWWSRAGCTTRPPRPPRCHAARTGCAWGPPSRTRRRSRRGSRRRCARPPGRSRSGRRCAVAWSTALLQTFVGVTRRGPVDPVARL